MYTYEEALAREALISAWVEAHPDGTPEEFADYCESLDTAYEYAALYPGYTVPNVATHTDGEAEARAIVRGWGAGKVVRRLPGGEWEEY